MNVKPVRDFVAVVKDDFQNKTSGGLYVPSISEDKIVTGKFVAVGSGHIGNSGLIPLEIEVGDKIAFNKTSSLEVKVDDTNLLMVREENIICKF
jgi:chaperonin GroES